MRKYGPDSLRNVAIVGHGGSGKTSLTEALLHACGAIDRMGRVEDGNTTTDFDPEEQRRGMSIHTAVAPCEWQGVKVNFLDVPGYADFIGEVQAALRVVDGCILVAPAQADLEVGFESAWEIAEEKGVARAVFVNKMDRENADYFRLVDRLREAHGKALAPLEIPIGQAESFHGVIDLVQMKAITYDGQGHPQEGPIPDDLADIAATYREQMVESAVENDDELLEKYLNGEELSVEEIERGLHLGVNACKVVPVMCGAAVRGIGAESLLDVVAHDFPHPTEMAPAVGKHPTTGKEECRKPSADEPLAALVFKTIADPYVGKLTYFRVYAGTMRSDSHVWNATKGKDERVGQLYILRGKSQEATDEVRAGEIAAVAKLSVTQSGDTLCDQTRPLIFEGIDFPAPCHSLAIFAKTKADDDKLGPALQRIADEDPTFSVRRDPETHETVISGMGETHLSIVLDRLKKFGAEVEPREPSVPYRETIRGSAQGQGRHKKQTGGRGQYGDCHVKLEPAAPGAGFVFHDKIVGGSIPRQYIPAVQKGLEEAMGRGIQAGFPVVDIEATVYDGSYHDVDSSEMAFKLAGILAFQNVAAQCHPVILEPMMEVTVICPEEDMGGVLSDLNVKRGRVMGMEPIGGGRQRIQATAPLSELQRYAIDLRSITRGRGTFTMEFSSYEEVPGNVTQRLIKDYEERKARGELHQAH